MKSWMRAGAWLSLALVAGCAGSEVRLPVATPFDLGGRIVVHDHEHGFTGTLRWECRVQSDDIWLSTPLGQSFVHLQTDGNSATLTTADHQQYRAASIESLTQSALGWRFPVAPLRHWVRGAPVPNMPANQVERDPSGRLTRIIQNEWRVEFSYAQDTATTPSRLEIVGDAAAIRLVIDRFEPLSP